MTFNLDKKGTSHNKQLCFGIQIHSLKSIEVQENETSILVLSHAGDLAFHPCHWGCVLGGQLVAVCGRVASGKSSLLLAMLGEMKSTGLVKLPSGEQPLGGLVT